MNAEQGDVVRELTEAQTHREQRRSHAGTLATRWRYLIAAILCSFTITLLFLNILQMVLSGPAPDPKYSVDYSGLSENELVGVFGPPLRRDWIEPAGGDPYLAVYWAGPDQYSQFSVLIVDDEVVRQSVSGR
ncbi:MAG: hypothetical protein AAGK09_11655 [Planctomycetota bacterium]